MAKASELHKSIKRFQVDEIFCNKDNNILGKGGFGTVRLGHHRVLGKLAIKCQPLQGSMQEMENSKKELLNEVRMMLLAVHKHVVRMEGLIECEDWTGIVMEHMPGGSMDKLIFSDTLAKIPPDLLLRMSCETTDAITYLHKLLEDQRIAHGDLKPQNILLSSDLHCKVADFGGAAFSFHTKSLRAGPDKPGEGRQYTLVFSAPERLTGDSERLTTAMDVFSVGVILYVAITQQYPEVQQNLLMLLLHIFPGIRLDMSLIDEYIGDLKSINDEHGAEIISLLKSLLVRCVKKDPSERPPMMEVRDELQQQLATIKPATMAQHVANVLAHVDIRDDVFQEEACQTINQAILSTSGNKQTNTQTNKQKPRPVNKETPAGDVKQKESAAFQNLRQKVKTVRDKLKEKDRDGWLNACEELIKLVEKDPPKQLSEEYARNVLKEITDLVEALLQTKPSGIFIHLLQSIIPLCNKVTDIQHQLDTFKRIATLAYAVAQNVKDDRDLEKAINNQALDCMIGLFRGIASLNQEEEEDVVKLKANIWYFMAMCNDKLGNQVLATIHLYSNAVNALKKTFGDSCKKLSVFGACCNNLGLKYEKAEKLKKAEKHFLEAHYCYREAESEKGDEWRYNKLCITFENICDLYEKNPTMARDKGREILEFFQKKLLKGVHRFKKIFLSLRMALLLDIKDDVISLCRDLAAHVTEPSSAQENSVEICEALLKKMSEKLLSNRCYNEATSMQRCGVSLSKLIPDVNDQIRCIYGFAAVMMKEVASIASFSSRVGFIPSEFIPLLNEMTAQIRQSTTAEERVRRKYLSACLGYLSCFYIKTKEYRKSFDAAKEAFSLLPTNLGDEANMSHIKSMLHLMLGYCNYKFKDYDQAETEFNAAVDLMKDDPELEVPLKQIRKFVENIRSPMNAIFALPMRLLFPWFL
ncbi:uncharacterized protein LOC143445764 [Clavelina lepadiformis]|uniref:uncharacterized protein LOC143445764 n=1 Tax=Clavelina lepadiformis TaxID=159417 RepID=UPI00404111EE